VHGCNNAAFSRELKANAHLFCLSLAKMLSSTNAFEISDIQEAETEGRTDQTIWM